LQEEDTSEHILIQCVTAREVYHHCKQGLRCGFRAPESEDTLEAWSIAESARIKARERKWFDGLICITGHALWKNRNAWCFNNRHLQKPAVEIAAAILQELKLLRTIRESITNPTGKNHRRRKFAISRHRGISMKGAPGKGPKVTQLQR
jgi:hypothetical protein